MFLFLVVFFSFLLPCYDAAEDDGPDEDPRATLVRRHALASVRYRSSRVAKGVVEVASLAFLRNRIWQLCCCG